MLLKRHKLEEGLGEVWKRYDRTLYNISYLCGSEGRYAQKTTARNYKYTTVSRWKVCSNPHVLQRTCLHSCQNVRFSDCEVVLTPEVRTGKRQNEC